MTTTLALKACIANAVSGLRDGACVMTVEIGETIDFAARGADRRLALTGFTEAEADGRWTDGPQAGMALRLAGGFGRRGVLQFRLTPFVADGHGQTLRLRGGRAPDRVVVFPPGSMVETMVEAPFDSDADGLARITLRLDNPLVPHDLGLGTDVRRLGVKIHDLRILSVAAADAATAARRQPDAVPLAPGERIFLSSRGAERRLSLSGFGQTESDGRWTVAPEAGFFLPLASAPPPGTVLRLTVTPFVTDGHGQDAELRWGDAPVRAVTFPPGPMGETTLDLPLDGSVPDGAGGLAVSLRIGAAMAPRDLGLGADARRLGLKIHDVQLVGAEGAPPPLDAALETAAPPGPIPSLGSRVKGRIKRRLRALAERLRRILNAPVEREIAALRDHLSHEIAALRDHHDQSQRGVIAATADQIRGVLEAQERTQRALYCLDDAVAGQGRAMETAFDRLRAGVLADLRRDQDQIADGARVLRRDQSQIADWVLGLHRKSDSLLHRYAYPVDDEAVLVRAQPGYLLCPRDDLPLLIALVDAGSLEPGLHELLKRLLRPGMAFVDAGANIGLHTLAAARLVGDGGHVHAFEPTPSTFRLLTRTLALNGFAERVSCHNVALGGDVGEADLHIGLTCGHNSLYGLPGEESGTVRVRLDRLDALLPPATRVDVVKIDVEGAELEVLRGMPRLLAENPDAVLLVEYGPSHLERIGLSPVVWFDAFAERGYHGYVIDEPNGAARPLEEVDVAAASSVNIAYVRPSSPLIGAVRGLGAVG